MWLRQSTASQEILLGTFLDSTDGDTAETGLTIANTDIKLWKEGATTEASKNSGGATHIASGRYYAVLDATDSDTLGKLEVNVHVAGALTVRREFMVLPAMIYDSLVLGTDDLDTNVTKVSGTAQTANDNGLDINAILVDTAEIGAAGAGLTNIGTIATVTTLTNKTGFSLASTGLDAIASTATGMVEIAKAIWDRVLTGATHNISTSAGRRVRQLADVIVWSGTAQGSGTGNNQIQLDTGASATDGAYDPSMVSIINGTGAGQTRLILEYDGTTKTATIDRNWKVNPDATSDFILTGHPGREHVNEGLAQAGTTTTITLNALASSVDDAYVGQTIFIRSGTGDDQAGLCNSYNGTSKVAGIVGVWGAVPDTTSAYVMLSTSLYDDTAVSNITTGAAAPSITSESSVLTTGTEVNTYTATHVLDGTYNETSDTAGTIDRYYQFDVDDDNVATSVAVNGRLEGDNDSLDVYAHNWVTTSWDRIGGLEGNAAGFADIVSVYTVIADYTGTGGDLNKIRIRYAGTGLTSATLFIDRAVMRYAAIPAPTVIENRQEMDSNSTQLAELNLGIIYSSAATGTLTTTSATTNLTGYADDQLIGRVMIVTSGNAEGEGTDITDYANATGLLTFTALTTAMANGDTFKIV